MKKIIYEKPSMKVVELQQRSMLLAGSVEQNNQMEAPGDYKDGGDPFSF